MDQRWEDAVFLHWRIPAAAAATRMPPGVRADVIDGSAWAGLVGFRMHRIRLGATVPLPWLGSFPEINVRLYSREQDGTRGVVFLSLDAPRLAVVLGARAAGIPYVWSRCRAVVEDEADPGFGYDVERRRGRTGTSFAVRPDRAAAADDELSLGLTARFGLHSRFAGRTVHVPVSHEPWPLHPAATTHLEDGLLAAAGLDVHGPPESVLFSPGVRTRIGRPRTVRSS
ncbi:YqjF family protein [Kocuria rhizosphaericola]|uniref:YqjF family protein n=1 Tax=Kocuria rhizosphaericola TaxID=3376284 RepID=UPI0037BCD304